MGRKRKYADVTPGDVFGEWTVLESPAPGPRDRALVPCRCSCGREGSVLFYELQRPGRSMSCMPCALRKNPKMNAAEAMRIASYKCGAADRSLEWSLSDQYALSLMSRPCHYCGADDIKSTVKSRTRIDGSFDVFTGVGIDRVDNEQGYTKKNCVPCCKRCNVAKGGMAASDFTQWLDQVARFRGKKKARRTR